MYNLWGKKYCKPSFSALKYCKNIISRQILVKIKNKNTNCHNFVNNIFELVYGPNVLSDHCLVEFTVQGSVDVVHVNDYNNNAYGTSKSGNNYYKWKPENKDDFVSSISSEEFKRSIFELNCNIGTANTTNDIDQCIDELLLCIDGVCKPLFGKRISDQSMTGENSNYNNKSASGMFDDVVRDKRQDFYYMLNLFRKDNNEINR